jgi:ATP-dependent DNA ligase
MAERLRATHRTPKFPAAAPWIPSLAHKPPAGPEWIHEIKHDGYRLIATVRLFTRRLSVSGQFALR